LTYNAYVTRIRNVRKHPNADRLLLGECFGNQVVVGLDTLEEQLGIYFPTDGCLSTGYLEANNLIGKIDPETGEKTGGFFDEKGRVRTQKFRKEKSDGYFAPLESLTYTGVDLNSLAEGTRFTSINNFPICKKYVTKETRGRSIQQKKRKYKAEYPLFHEHIDTEQLAYNLDKIPANEQIIITEKVHGTSQRSSYTLVTKKNRFYNLINGIFKREILKKKESWEYVCGTRRVIITDSFRGYFGEGDKEFRERCHNLFVNKLHKGETIYYEIVGWVDIGQLISKECDNKKLQDKEFIKKYGKTTRFTYGCSEGECDVYVYRITHTNVDGIEIDLSWNEVVNRCQQLGVKHVPMLYKTIFLEHEIKNLISALDMTISIPSTIDPSHIMEGIVLRIDGSKWKVYKHKSFEFKVIEGIIKDIGTIDIEESS